MGEVQGQGYIAQAGGAADVLAECCFHALRCRPEAPYWEGRDRFLLSIGHYAVALYAALIEAGVIPQGELETYGSPARFGYRPAVPGAHRRGRAVQPVLVHPGDACVVAAVPWISIGFLG